MDFSAGSGRFFEPRDSDQATFCRGRAISERLSDACDNRGAIARRIDPTAAGDPSGHRGGRDIAAKPELVFESPNVLVRFCGIPRRV